MKVIFQKAMSAWSVGRLLLMLGMLVPVHLQAQETISLCAEVQLEIRQELTTERQAFDARMIIGNGLPQISIDDLQIDLVFTDDLGDPVLITSDPMNTNALFFIRIDTLDGVGDVSGTGSVAPQTDAEIHWLIIPAPGAAGTSPLGRSFEVGANVTYTLGGEPKDLQVVPDTIFVRPTAKLVLDYFLPNQVYADDAFTAEVEPSIPFSLGVRVGNNGFGVANAMKIDSGQPEIVENELGLLVEFIITGSEVNGVAFAESLLVDFGDIAGGEAGVARWTMETTLSGEFSEFTAEYSHADDLGEKVTSLIEGLNTHLLVRDVLVDLPGRDSVRDFLALDGPSHTVYESDNIDTLVSFMTNAATLVLVETMGTRQTYTLDVPDTAGPLYVQKAFSNDTLNLSVLSATRDDGKRLPLANAWFSRTRETGTDPWENFLNLFDVNGGGIYTVVVDGVVPSNAPPVLTMSSEAVTRIGDVGGISEGIRATDVDGTLPTLAHTALPPGAMVVLSTNGLAAEGDLSWLPGAGQEGIYPITFTASDGVLEENQTIKLYVGQAGEPLDTNGIPSSLSGRSVIISNVLAATTSGTATVYWPSLPGIEYDIYYTDDPLDESETWSLLESNRLATTTTESIDDSTLGTNRMWRFYQIVLAGEAPMPRGIWGVIRHDVAAMVYDFLAPPLRGDRSIDGEYGLKLAEVLVGDDGGPADRVGDEVWILEPTGRWRNLWLDEVGLWREVNGAFSKFQFADGQGFILEHNTPSAERITFTGEVGNDGTKTVTLEEGWNLVALSEGRTLDLAEVFTSPISGTPIGGNAVTNADRVVVWDSVLGVTEDLIYADGLGPALNGKWVDPIGLTAPAVDLRPGQAIYYYRQEGGGPMVVGY